MVYKCVSCGAIYQDASNEVITGCSTCKSKFFFYIKEEKLQEILANKASEPVLNPAEIEQMEEDVREITGVKDEEVPVFLDFESVKVIKPGKYLLDIAKLFQMGKPRVYKLEDGKYIVDLTSIMGTKNVPREKLS